MALYSLLVNTHENVLDSTEWKSLGILDLEGNSSLAFRRLKRFIASRNILKED